MSSALGLLLSALPTAVRASFANIESDELPPVLRTLQKLPIGLKVEAKVLMMLSPSYSDDQTNSVWEGGEKALQWPPGPYALCPLFPLHGPHAFRLPPVTLIPLLSLHVPGSSPFRAYAPSFCQVTIWLPTLSSSSLC